MAFPSHAVANLEAPDVREFAATDPRGFLAQFDAGVVLDEIQRVPELTSYLQGLIDADPRPGRWILTGSQSLTMMESVSQSLAGRTAVLHLLPLARPEVRRFKRHPQSLTDTLCAGGYPRIHDQQIEPADWLSAYVRTYLERDLRQLTNVGDLATFQRFVQLCASRTGQLLNLSSLALDAGIAQPTAKAWLSGPRSHVHRLPPPALLRQHRQAPGQGAQTPLLRHRPGLLAPRNPRRCPTRPAPGSRRNLRNVGRRRNYQAPLQNRGEHAGLYFYRDRQGHEADLIIEQGGQLTVVEAKAGQTPTPDLTGAARRVADFLAETGPTERIVVYGGAQQRAAFRGRPIVMGRARRASVVATGRRIPYATMSVTTGDLCTATTRRPHTVTACTSSTMSRRRNCYVRTMPLLV